MIRVLALALAVALAIADEVATRAAACYVFVANGSGVVIDPAGLVLTNHHVVDGEEDDLQVRWSDGVSVPAQVLGLDPVGDLALLSAPRPDGPAPAAALADPAELVPGAAVLAVGNPFGLGDLDDVASVSRGVLGTGRIVRGDYADAVQVDAPVNPGNSGGPLFSATGRLLGINGQIHSRTGFRINSGIGLAIACSQIADFIPLLKAAEGGYVHHAALPEGLTLEDGPSGPLVGNAGGGLLPGDVLLVVAGRRAASANHAIGCFRALAWRPGRTVLVRVQRGGAAIELQVPTQRGVIPGRPYYGWSLAERSDRVQLAAVDPHSPAERAGLRRGDVLLAADGHPLGPRIDLLRALVRIEPGDRVRLKRRSADGGELEVTLLVRRSGGTP